MNLTKNPIINLIPLSSLNLIKPPTRNFNSLLNCSLHHFSHPNSRNKFLNSAKNLYSHGMTSKSHTKNFKINIKKLLKQQISSQHRKAQTNTQYFRIQILKRFLNKFQTGYRYCRSMKFPKISLKERDYLRSKTCMINC